MTEEANTHNLSLDEALGRKKWNVHIQERYDHGQGVAIYLARYVRGGPMSNRRLLEADEEQVTFCYHDYRDGQDKPMTLPTPPISTTAAVAGARAGCPPGPLLRVV